MTDIEWYWHQIELYGLEGMELPHYELFTCYICYFNTVEAYKEWSGCECQRDSYNTDGDCLAIK